METGEAVWKYTGSEEQHCHSLSSPAAANGLVYVGCSDASTYALNNETGAYVFAHNTTNFEHTSPILSPDGKTMYVGEQRGFSDKTYAVDAFNGTELWNFHGVADGDPTAGLATLADGTVLVFREGQIYALTPAGEIIWRSRALGDALGGDSAATSVAVTTDNKVIVATNGESKKPGKVIALSMA